MQKLLSIVFLFLPIIMIGQPNPVNREFNIKIDSQKYKSTYVENYVENVGETLANPQIIGGGGRIG